MPRIVGTSQEADFPTPRSPEAQKKWTSCSLAKKCLRRHEATSACPLPSHHHATARRFLFSAASSARKFLATSKIVPGSLGCAKKKRSDGPIRVDRKEHGKMRQSLGGCVRAYQSFLIGQQTTKYLDRSLLDAGQVHRPRLRFCRLERF